MGDKRGANGGTAVVGHCYVHAAGLAAASLKAVGPGQAVQSAIRWCCAVWPGTDLPAGDWGFVTALVSVWVGQHITCQPAGAFGTGMQRVPVEVLFRCATVSDKGRGVVYAPHTFTLAHLQDVRRLKQRQFPSGNVVPWAESLCLEEDVV